MVRYVIGRETWFHDFGGFAASYISEIHFERLAAGDTTECGLGMMFVNWCIVTLYCYVNFFHSCIIIIVANISHTGRRIIA